MSDENPSLIQKVFVDEHGARYPIVKTDNKTFRTYGIRAYPTYVVLDASGKVHSTGSPSEATIEQLLKDVRLVPKAPDGAAYDPLRDLWEKRRFQKLEQYLDKMLQQENLDADMRTVFTEHRATLDKWRERAVRRAGELAKGPDFFGAEQDLERIAKEWQGLAPAEAANKELERFKEDATIKKEVAAGKALEKLLSRYDTSKQSQARKLREELRKFAEKYSGTHAADKAMKLAAE